MRVDVQTVEEGEERVERVGVSSAKGRDRCGFRQATREMPRSGQEGYDHQMRPTKKHTMVHMF